MAAENNRGVSALLIIIGLCLFLWGAYDITKVGDHALAVADFNQEVADWDGHHRAAFDGLTSGGRSVRATVHVLEEDPASALKTQKFQVAAAGHSAGQVDSSKYPALADYSQLQYVTESAFTFSSVSLAQWGGDGGTRVMVGLTLLDSDGTPTELTPEIGAEGLALFEEKPTGGNAKVCRNEHGHESAGKCYFNEVVTQLCFILAEAPDGRWRLDARRGCYSRGSRWEYAKTVRTVSAANAHAATKRDASFSVALVSAHDPWIVTESTPGEESELESDPKTTGWLLAVFGGLILAFGGAQLYLNLRAEKEDEASQGIYAPNNDYELPQQASGPGFIRGSAVL